MADVIATGTDERGGDTSSLVDFNFDTAFSKVDRKLDEVLDAIDELDNTEANDEYGVVEPPKTDNEMSKDDLIKNLEQRIEKLESKS